VRPAHDHDGECILGDDERPETVWVCDARACGPDPDPVVDAAWQELERGYARRWADDEWKILQDIYGPARERPEGWDCSNPPEGWVPYILWDDLPEGFQPYILTLADLLGEPSRYDAAPTVAAFRPRLRDQVDLAGLTPSC
jgi:hypothetical protein